MVRETWVQSYQRLKKWFLMPPCLTLSIIRYGSRVKQSNPVKGVAPSPTPWCCSYRKGSLRGTPDYGRQLYLRWKKRTNKRSHTYVYIHTQTYIYIYIYYQISREHCVLLTLSHHPSLFLVLFNFIYYSE